MADGASLTAAPRRAPDETMAAFATGFESACARSGTFEDRVLIAGQRILLRFAGDAMRSRQAEAFRGRPTWDAGTPDLTVLS